MTPSSCGSIVPAAWRHFEGRLIQMQRAAATETQTRCMSRHCLRPILKSNHPFAGADAILWVPSRFDPTLLLADIPFRRNWGFQQFGHCGGEAFAAAVDGAHGAVAADEDEGRDAADAVFVIHRHGVLRVAVG